VRQDRLIKLFGTEPRVVDKEDFPKDVSLRLLAGLATLYEHRGLLDLDQPQPLWDCCPNGKHCWRGLRKPRSRNRNNGRITLPWVGPDYTPGQLVVLANNLNNASGWLTEYEIVCSSASSETNLSQIGSFEAGKRKAHRSPFAYRSMRTAAMLLDQLDGIPVTDRTEPGDLVPTINRVARLQTVKCAPDKSNYGTPPSAMLKACPPLLLAAELKILDPAIVLTLGQPAAKAISTLPNFQPVSQRGAIRRASIPIGERTVSVYSVAHPTSTANWQTDHDALKRHLRRHQARTAAR
jgi:hypothetical protein